MKDWDNDIKREVRSTIIGLAKGKKYSKVVDLPGNRLLSTIEMVKHNVVAPDGEIVLFENDENEIQAIYDGMTTHGLPNCNLYLFEDVAEVRNRYFDGVGFFNYDSMSHLTPRGMHLIDRIGWAPNATLAITLYHSDTRSKSKFLTNTLSDFNKRWDSKKRVDALSELREVYHHLTYSNNEIIHEHHTMGPSRVIDKHIEYSSMLYMLLKYALRNHNYNLRCAILYSGSKNSLAARMITFYIDGITKHTQPHPKVMVMDRGSSTSMVENLNDYYA